MIVGEVSSREREVDEGEVGEEGGSEGESKEMDSRGSSGGDEN